MALDQTHAVSKITENLNQQGASSVQEGTRAIPNKESFQAFLNPSSTAQTADSQSIPIEKETDIAHSQTLGQDNVKAQQSESSLDDQGKRKKQEQIEEIDSPSRAKKTDASSSTEEKVETTIKPTEGTASTETIQKDIEQSLAHIEKAKKRLSRPGETIKPSYQTLVRNHLGHVNEHLQIALSKTGIEQTPPAVASQERSTNPLIRALDAFTHSENQLNSLHGTIGKLKNEHGGINPVDLLAIQIKVGYIQQQLELLNNLLNKALESTKTIMNVQV